MMIKMIAITVLTVLILQLTVIRCTATPSNTAAAISQPNPDQQLTEPHIDKVDDENPKQALMAVVKILLNGGEKKELQEDLDKYYEMLGRKEFLVDSTEFLDRELVNIYLVHHITFGKFIDKMYSDSTDAYRLNVKDEDPSADVPDIKRHKNAEVNAKLKKIEEIFKARDDKGLITRMSEQFQIIEENLKKNKLERSDKESESITEHLEIMIDLMVISIVKSRLRDYIPQFELHILFDHLDQEHVKEQMNIDWMKKYRMLRKYFLSHMLVGQMMDMVNSCTTGVKKDKKIEKAPEHVERDDDAEEDSDDDDSEYDDDDDEEYHEFVDNLLDLDYSNKWCDLFITNAKIIHWHAKPVMENVELPHNLVIGTVLSAIGHIHKHPEIIAKRLEWFAEIYKLEALARHSLNMNDMSRRTMAMPRYKEARKMLEKALFEDHHKTFDNMRRLTLKVARLYAMAADHDDASFQQINNEFSELIKDIIELDETEYLDDIVQQMLHAIEDSLNKRGINQPPKYQECSRKFQINTELMEKLYANDDSQTSQFTTIRADLYTKFGAERLPNIKYFYFFLINLNYPTYNYMHFNTYKNSGGLWSSSYNEALRQYKIVSDAKISHDNQELKTMRQSKQLQEMLKFLEEKADKDYSNMKQKNGMSDVFIPLLNIQDLAITNADVHEPNLHAELKRLNQAILDDKHKEVGTDDLPVVFSLSDIFKKPNDLNDFAELKNFLAEGKIIHAVQAKIKADGATKDWDLLFILAIRAVFTYSSSYDEHLSNIRYFYVLIQETQFQGKSISELTKFEMAIAHDALETHYHLDQEKTSKLPLGLFKLIGSKLVQEYLSEYDVGGYMWRHDIQRLSFNKITARPTDYIIYNAHIAIALLSIQDSYGVQSTTDKGDHIRPFTGSYQDAATLLANSLKVAKEKFAFIRPFMFSGISKLKIDSSMHSSLLAEQRTALKPFISDCQRRGQIMDDVYAKRGNKIPWRSIIEPKINAVKTKGVANTQAIEEFYLVTSGFANKYKHQSGWFDDDVAAEEAIRFESIIIDKILQQSGYAENTEWVQLRLSDYGYFSNFKATDNTRHFNFDKDSLIQKIAKFHKEHYARIAGGGQQIEQNMCSQWHYFLSDIMATMEFKEIAADEFFAKERHCQWSLAIIDFQLLDVCDKVDIWRNLKYRPLLTANLKMPNMYSNSKEPVEKAGTKEKPGTKEKKTTRFTPFTEAQLKAAKSKMTARAKKESNRLQQLAQSLLSLQESSTSLNTQHGTFAAFLPFNKELTEQVTALAQKSSALNQTLKRMIDWQIKEQSRVKASAPAKKQTAKS